MRKLLIATILSILSAPLAAQTSKTPQEFESIPDAYAALVAEPGATITKHENGWETVAVPEGDYEGAWSFAPQNHPAYPSVVKRKLINSQGNLYVDTKVRCGAPKTACNQLVLDFRKLDDEIYRMLMQKQRGG
jgi:hypothetical protein